MYVYIYIYPFPSYIYIYIYIYIRGKEMGRERGGGERIEEKSPNFPLMAD